MKHEYYLVGSCTLHNLKTALRNDVVNVLGEGGSNDGDYRMNVMQLLHGAYNLQNWHEIEELREIWQFVQTLNEDALTFKKIRGASSHKMVACRCLRSQFQRINPCLGKYLYWYQELVALQLSKYEDCVMYAKSYTEAHDH